MTNSESNYSFVPTVFNKCSAAIESCKLIEQLHVANKMVENNYSNLTEVQYSTLKNRIARHPCAAHLVMIPFHTEQVFFVQRTTLIILTILGLASWATLVWWFL